MNVSCPPKIMALYLPSIDSFYTVVLRQSTGRWVESNRAIVKNTAGSLSTIASQVGLQIGSRVDVIAKSPVANKTYEFIRAVKNNYVVLFANSVRTDLEKIGPEGFTKYEDVNGVSGVDAYHIGANYITVRFKGGALYTYFESKMGAANFQNMIGCAELGHGLNGYIMTNPRIRSSGRKGG